MKASACGRLAAIAAALARTASRLLVLAAVPSAAAMAAVEVKVVDAEGRPVPGAVVFLESPEAQARLRAQPPAAELVQKDKRFVPQVLVVPVGTPVAFPNRDTVRHHVYSFSPAKPFEIKLYVGTPASPVVFDRPGVVVLGCNIHDQMVGWVVVVPTPHFERTDDAGLARVDAVPPGRYRLRVWHERLGTTPLEQPLAVGPTGASALATIAARR